MSVTTPPRQVELGLSPLQAVRAWPTEIPAAALISGKDSTSGRSRWSILASPQEWVPVDGRGSLVPASRLPATAALPDAPAFDGGWIGFLGYELGAVLEPHAAAPFDAKADADAFPTVGAWARCDSAYVYDNLTGLWSIVGDPDDLPRPEELHDRAVEAASGRARAPEFLSPLHSQMGREAYERAVARAVEYIRAGDVFQVNLAHMLRARMRGSPRELFAALGDTAAPWYGALLETPWGVIASASPELFLDFDARTRSVVTRPMKGTRGGEHAPAELLASEKDAAELNMIVDLMRNDLGRVCEFGSVQVQAPREVEAHGAREPAERNERAASGVLQGVATVRGTVRRGFGLDELLRAAFPPGSITGAPKVRAMQIIGELEAAPRGPYCGCIGFVSDSGRAEFSVAIRTAVLTPAQQEAGPQRAQSGHGGTEANAGGVEETRDGARAEPIGGSGCAAPDAGTSTWDVRYGVGAGIVADSDPAAEWRETLIKARIWHGIADIADATQTAEE